MAVRNVALYHPLIDPPDAWIKRSLLYCDAVSSIVPIDYSGRATETMQWLTGEGLWAPTFTYGIDDREDYTAEIEDVVLEFAGDDGWRVTPGTPSEFLTAIYPGKLSPAVEHRLEEFGLCRFERSGEWKAFAHPYVAAVVLSVTARHLCDANTRPDQRLVPSTDRAAALHFAFAPTATSSERYECVEANLRGLLPEPGPSVSIQDVVAFRQRNQDLLHEYRQQLHGFCDELRDSGDPPETLRRQAEGVAASLASLRHEAARRGTLLLAGSASIVLVGAAIAGAIPADDVHWFFDGLGTAAGATVATRLARGRPGRSPYTYLLRAADEFERSPRGQ